MNILVLEELPDNRLLLISDSSAMSLHQLNSLRKGEEDLTGSETEDKDQKVGSLWGKRKKN